VEALNRLRPGGTTIGTVETTVATVTGEEAGAGRVRGAVSFGFVQCVVILTFAIDAVGTPTTRTVMIIMTPRATDTVPAMVAMTTDTTHSDAIVAIEITTMSAIGMTTVVRNAIVRLADRGVRASAVTVPVAGLVPGAFGQTPAHI
jgi:hypothetical protein